MKQQTISRDISVSGKALHTGNEVRLTFRPSEPNTGIIFQRIDIDGGPELRPSIDHVGDLVRNTTIDSGHMQIHTVEHVLSALTGMEIDNIRIEINSSELPILDGSSRLFIQALQNAKIVQQTIDREYFEIDYPIFVSEGQRSLTVIPYNGLKITCTSVDDRGIHTQHLSLDITRETYISELASARTFTAYEDIEKLLRMGKIQGGSLDSAIVIKGDQILSKEPLRFKDEFVRHKMLDIIGDLTLLGVRIMGHIIAICPGHALNAKLTKKINEAYNKKKIDLEKRNRGNIKRNFLPSGTSLDIDRILQALPHRYPFLMIDKVLEITKKDEIRAIKKVTTDELFCTGYFPQNPLMPGALQIEAMVQATGVLMILKSCFIGRVAYFMSADRVKFRAPVVPGDQMEIYVQLKKLRGGGLVIAHGSCKVNGRIVSSAVLKFKIA